MPISTITANSVANNSLTTDQFASAAVHGRRNLIINGAMQVWQRATAATTATNQCTTVDRHAPLENTSGNYTTERSTDTPSGTGYSLKCVVTTADATLTTTEYSMIQHGIEAQSLQHLLYGTASAKTLTLSFWVKSNKTGTYGIALYKQDVNSTMYNKEYTINAANTWEKKEITITPTAGGTSIINTSAGNIDNDSGPGLYLSFGLAWGPSFTGGTSDSWSSNTSHYATTNHVNWMDTVSNNFYLAQVQLEVGEQATPFEHRSYGDELAACQRYCHIIGDTQYQAIGIGTMYTSTASIFYVHTPVSMRGSPSVSKVAGGVGTTWLQSYSGSTGTNSNPTPELGENSTNGRQNNFRIYVPGSNSSTTVGSATWNQIMPNASLIFDAEI